jgi:hypothetical protein
MERNKGRKKTENKKERKKENLTNRRNKPLPHAHL